MRRAAFLHSSVDFRTDMAEAGAEFSFEGFVLISKILQPKQSRDGKAAKAKTAATGAIFVNPEEEFLSDVCY